MQRTKFFVILDHFLPFIPLPEKSKFGKNEKKAWTYYYFTHVYQKWQSWCMVPEIWSLTNWFFCHCGPFFALLPPPHPLTTPPKKFLKMIKMHRDIILLHMCTINENHMIMVPLILSTTDRTFCHFGPFFALLPPSNPKSQKFWKRKKMPGDIIILHKITKNHVHMLHCSWDMMHDRCNFYFSFWAIFLPFCPSNNPKY